MRKTNSPITLFILIALTRLFGFVRSLLIARIWGSGEEAAAFELSQTVSAVLYDMAIGAVIAAMFVPAYVKRKTEAEKSDLISALLPRVFAFGFLLYLPLIVFPKTVLSLSARELTESLLSKAAPALSVLSVGRATLSPSCLLVGVLQSENRAASAALLYALSSLTSLIFTAAFSEILTAFMLAFVITGLDILLLILLTRSVRSDHTVKLSSTRRHFLTKQVVLRAFWVILSGIFLPLLTLFTSLSSAKLAGSVGISLNGYAGRLILLTAALLTSVTHAAYYAAIAKEKDRKRLMKKITLRLFLISLFVTVLILAFARPLIGFLYRNSAMTEADLDLLVSLLWAYAPSVIALTLSSLLFDFAYLQNRSAYAALSNLAAIALASLIYSVIGLSSLSDIPLYFTLTAYLRLIFTACTVFSYQKHEKVRILLVLSDRNIGGAGRWLLSYLENADRADFDIHIALPGDAALAKEVEALGYPIHPMGSERSFSFKNTYLACRLMLRLHPDLVNTSASFSARLAAFLVRVPVRIYTRHCVFQTPVLYKSRTVRLGHRLLQKLITPTAIAVAPEAKDCLVAMGIAKRSIITIPNGVMPMIYDPVAAKEIQTRFHIENAPAVAICGRLEKDKSVSTLLYALAKLKENGEPFHALIVGTGKEEDALKALCETLDISDRVHFCGFVFDVAPYLSAADIYANCSIGSEATSLAIAEAMSLSLPIVASRYGGNPHMVIDGKNGILVRPQDPSELADALQILTDPAVRMKFGSSSHDRYTAHYRADTMARQYEALYRSLLHRKGYTTL